MDQSNGTCDYLCRRLKPKVNMHPSSSQSRSERALEPVRKLVGQKERIGRGHNPDPFRVHARSPTPVQEGKKTQKTP